jgi:tetratricopeptide (TPR) repeat protein
MPDRTPQHELSDLLQTELYHTLGSYGTVVRRLRALERRMRPRDKSHDWGALFPAATPASMLAFNESLRANFHLPAALRRDPSAFVDVATPPRHPNPDLKDDPPGQRERHRWVLDYAFSSSQAVGGAVDATPEQRELGRLLKLSLAPRRRGPHPDTPTSARGRRMRYARRLERAQQLTRQGEGSDRSAEILQDHLGRGVGEDPLHMHVVGALIEAHCRMHRAEHLASHAFGDAIEHRVEIDRRVRAELDMSLLLNTFVYAAGRGVPWIFAENDDERREVIADYERCCKTLTPTYCMWIGNQLSMLALHRRAFTWMLLDKPDRAYHDFQKLQAFILGLERQVDDRVLQAPGAKTFLRGLSALADHHSGRIYRSQHAHIQALDHFDRAARRLQQLEEHPELEEMLHNSRWRVNLLVSQAKAKYELGPLKESLLCYLRAWRAFLELADTESNSQANLQVVDGVIGWLERVAPDALFNKVVLRARMQPLVAQLEQVRGPAHLRILAADIMLRLAHVLFMVKLPQMNGDTVVRRADGEPVTDHGLARQSLLQAARLDPTHTLIAADLLKVNRVAPGDGDGPDESATELDPSGPQWPGGGGLFEEAARVVEYVMESWLTDTPEAKDASAVMRIARQLLASFLIHTDSTNVKLAQVFRYLMQGSSHDDVDDDDGPDAGGRAYEPMPPRLELVCMRRYSSFFPFLPRPSAFRVLGGGYFVRVEESRAEGEKPKQPFGIVIDPGPNFILNLYRCGYCLADVDMVIVTHDHADHISELDPLLSLIGYRDLLGPARFGPERKLMIIGNDSVKRRYAFYNDSDRLDNVSVWTFDEWYAATSATGSTASPSKRSRTRRVPFGLRAPRRTLDDLHAPPSTVRIEPVRTAAHTDAASNVAQGFLLSIGEGPTRSAVLFTSDTGLPEDLWPAGLEPPKDGLLYSRGSKTLREAIAEARVVVAHVSSVPVPELRRLAGFDRRPDDDERTAAFQRLWETARQQVDALSGAPPHTARGRADRRWARKRGFLLRQLQFGFHARPKRSHSSHDGLAVSPLSPCDDMRPPAERHLYLNGLLAIAERLHDADEDTLLVIGELREELSTFRTRIARSINEVLFEGRRPRALTGDVGLKLRIQPPGRKPTPAGLPEILRSPIEVLCTTCDLNNDLVDEERFHAPHDVFEVCVKGDDEGVFYNCHVHDAQRQPEPEWVERVERYDPFGR